MTTSPHRKIKVIHITPQTWFGRLLSALIALSILILIIFFFSVLFAAFLTISIVVLGWVLWSKRQSPPVASGDTIEGEFSVDNLEPSLKGDIIKRRSRH